MLPILTFRVVNSDFETQPISINLGPDINSLDQASNQLPEGAYTTFRTYPGKSAFHLDEHFQRLEESLALTGYKVALDRYSIRNHIRSILADYPSELARLRITVPLGQNPPIIYISIGALTVPAPEKAVTGVSVLTTPFIREKPKAKLTDFISSSSEIRNSIPSGIEEILMVGENGNLLEGLTSNFYAVINQTIYTADEGILNGITRNLTLKLANNAGIKVNLTPPNLQDVPNFDETFITSTSRAILPVTMINSEKIGTGKPGPVTKQLMQLFDYQVTAEIRPI